MTPSGMKSRSSGNGVKAKRKIVIEPNLLKTFARKSIFFLYLSFIAFLPPTPSKYPDNSPIAEPVPATTAIHIGSNVFPRAKITIVYGTGKKMDDAPIRLIRKIPK
jgi:hypothetical protein